MLAHPYLFDDFEVNAVERTLRRNGELVAIRPKSFATLVHLIENRGRVVSKQELLDELWPDVVVQEQAVFQSISELRAIFAGRSCIETVRGRGYQWVAKSAGQKHMRKHRWLRWSVVASGIAAVAAAFLWIQEPKSPARTLIIHPAASVNLPPGGAVASGLDAMLVEHLRRMGWRARRLGTAPQETDALQLLTQVSPDNAGIEVTYSLLGPGTDFSGRVSSVTPLGVIRDLASQLQPILAQELIAEEQTPLVNDLFLRGRRYLDNDDFETANAYLRVVLAEQPDHVGAKIALAMSYKQTGRYQDAHALAYSAYDLATSDAARPERMVTALLLSQILLLEEVYDESEELANEALLLASQTNDLLVVAEAQEQLGEISLATGRVESGREQLIVARQFYSSFCPTGESRVSQRLSELEATNL